MIPKTKYFGARFFLRYARSLSLLLDQFFFLSQQTQNSFFSLDRFLNHSPQSKHHISCLLSRLETILHFASVYDFSQLFFITLIITLKSMLQQFKAHTFNIKMTLVDPLAYPFFQFSRTTPTYSSSTFHFCILNTTSTLPYHSSKCFYAHPQSPSPPLSWPSNNWHLRHCSSSLLSTLPFGTIHDYYNCIIPQTPSPLQSLHSVL